jgi:hypothetical protein
MFFYGLLLESGIFKRPILKTVRRHFGARVDLYGGRKEFPDLMLSLGHSLENISIWMGHSTLDRTWRSYKSRRRFHLSGYPAWRPSTATGSKPRTDLPAHVPSGSIESPLESRPGTPSFGRR